MEKYNGMPDDGLIGMLWVVILMASMVVTVVGKKMNERRRMRIGVELELVKKHRLDGVDPNHSMANWFKLRGFEAQRASYGSATTTQHIKVQPDSSLPSGGFEIVSMPLYDGTHRKWLRSVFDAIKGLTKITRECSSHIHVGLKSHGKEWGEDGGISYNEAMAIAGNTAYAYSYFEPGIDTIVSESRRNNDYCRNMTHVVQQFPNGLVKSWTDKTWNDETASYDEKVMTYTPSEVSVMIYEATRGTRYYKLNTQSLNKHGTLEFRQHQAVNFDSTKLNNWIQLCYDMTMRCADEASMLTIKEYPRTLAGLFGFLGMKDNSLHNYFKSRATILAGGSLNTACTTCGSYRCMEDNRCSDIAEADSYWSEFEEASRPIREAPSMYECDECGHVHDAYDTFNRQYNAELGSWVARFDDHCGECESWQPTATGYYGMSAIGLGLVLMFPIMSAIALLVGCGIGAIHGAAKKFNVKTRFRKLWAALANRGNQAAGMAYQTPKSIMFLKDALSSEQLSHSVKNNINTEVQWALCHTRFATHGSNTADNAHPHFSSSNRITLVHNGVVSNYETVWKSLDRPQTGPVDSQAIAECLEVGGIEKVVELCKGNMSLIWSNQDDPIGTLKCWTNGGNPLHMGRLDDADNGAVVIASTKAHLDTMGARLVSDWACIIGREYTIHPDGSITKRDIEGSAKTVNAMVSWRSYAKTNYWDNWDTPTKATGNADNCSIDDDISPALLNQACNHVYTIMDDMGGWPAFKCEGKEFHGYDALSHEGVTNGGIRYKLPFGVDPTVSADDMDDLLCGDFYGGDLYDFYGIYDNWQ